jgi:hypothetical protein
MFQTINTPSRLVKRNLSSATTLGINDLKERGLLTVDTSSAPVILTIPSPQEAFDGWGFAVFSDGDGSGNAAVLSCTNGFANDGDSYSVSDGQLVLIGCKKDSGGTYRWIPQATPDLTKIERQTYTPTFSWTTATPTLTSTNYEFWIIDGKFVLFILNFSTADGGGASAVTITPPILPPDIDVLVPIKASMTVDGTATDVWGYLDCTQATAEDRLIKLHNFQAWTDDKACSARIIGFYPIKAADWAAAETYATNSVTENADAWTWGDVGFAVGSWNDTDSDAAATFSCVLPFCGTPDRDGYMPALIHEISGAGGVTRTNAKGFIDLANAASASRAIGCKDYTAPTDGQACRIDLAAFFELGGWKTWTPTLTFDVDPASITKAGYYKIQGGFCLGWAYFTSADGNDAATLEIDLPAVPAYQANRVIPVWGYQLQNASHYLPDPYIPANQAAAADRQKISFDNFQAATDTETVTGYVAFIFPV